MNQFSWWQGSKQKYHKGATVGFKMVQGGKHYHNLYLLNIVKHPFSLSTKRMAREAFLKAHFNHNLLVLKPLTCFENSLDSP